MEAVPWLRLQPIVRLRHPHSPCKGACRCATQNFSQCNTSCSRLTGQRTHQHTPAHPARPSEEEGTACPNHACRAKHVPQHAISPSKEWSLLAHKCCMASTESTRCDVPPVHPGPPHRKNPPHYAFSTHTINIIRTRGGSMTLQDAARGPSTGAVPQTHLADPSRQRPAACLRCRHCPQLPIETPRIPSAALQHAPCNQHTPRGG